MENDQPIRRMNDWHFLNNKRNSEFNQFFFSFVAWKLNTIYTCLLHKYIIDELFSAPCFETSERKGNQWVQMKTKFDQSKGRKSKVCFFMDFLLLSCEMNFFLPSWEIKAHKRCYNLVKCFYLSNGSCIQKYNKKQL